MSDQFTLRDVREEYRRLDKLCGVSTEGILLKVSTRGVKRLGSCHFSRRNHPDGKSRLVPDSISLSDVIFTDERLFWNVIRHEYAHALVCLRTGKSHGHDEVWQRACKEIGCNPSRTTSTEGIEAVQKRQAERVKFIIRCKSCGREWRYFRKSLVVEDLLKNGNNSRYRCSYCKKNMTLELEVIQ